MKDNSFLLINSPIFWKASTDNEEYLSPLGLAYIATHLKKAGINVELIDCVKEKLSVNRIIDIINNDKPSAVGINIFTQNYELVKYIIENICITTTIFIGGQTVKSIYNDIISWNVKNRLNIIIGEGELILPDLALNRCLENPVKVTDNKYVYRVNNDSIYFPKDISNIFIGRCFLKNEIIINHYGEKEAAIVTSRGCLYNCAFCGGAKGLNNDIKIRIRNSDSIIREIDEIISIYPDVQSIRILDDLFLRNKQSI
ncbi:MAG: B12-binding domain-containing radical SAM protein, partial [Candidatus Gastranaerophilaceae bacterium]